MSLSHVTDLIRSGKELSRREQVMMTIQPSPPAILAQISLHRDAVRGCIDGGSSRCGRFRIHRSYLFQYLAVLAFCSAVAVGFTIHVAQRIGAKDAVTARNIGKEGKVVSLAFSFLLLFLGLSIASRLPVWLGGTLEIVGNARWYFLIYVLCLPVMELNVIDALLIFPSGIHRPFGLSFTLPGAGLGVLGLPLDPSCRKCRYPSLCSFAYCSIPL